MVKELSIKIAQDIINDNNPDSFLKELFNKPLSDNELYCVVSVTNNPAFRHLYSSFDYCTTMKEILEKSKLESTDLKSILLMMMIKNSKIIYCY